VERTLKKSLREGIDSGTPYQKEDIIVAEVARLLPAQRDTKVKGQEQNNRVKEIDLPTQETRSNQAERVESKLTALGNIDRVKEEEEQLVSQEIDSNQAEITDSALAVLGNVNQGREEAVQLPAQETRSNQAKRVEPKLTALRNIDQGREEVVQLFVQETRSNQEEIIAPKSTTLRNVGQEGSEKTSTNTLGIGFSAFVVVGITIASVLHLTYGDRKKSYIGS